MNRIDIFKIEEKFRLNLRLSANNSLNNNLLFSFIDLFEELFGYNDQVLIEAYIIESIDSIITLLNNYSVFGKPIEHSERVLIFLRKIILHPSITEFKKKIESSIDVIQKEVSFLNNILSGSENETVWSKKVSFPLVEKSINGNSFGSIDAFTVILNPTKNKKEDEFLVVPSLPKLDQKIVHQLKISWNYAKNFIRKTNKKKIPIFKVVIHYEKKFGIYVGDSNGVALTLGFISELTNYFNLRKSYRINEAALFTGIVNEDGSIAEVSQDIIKIKTRIAFYSNFNSLVIPSNDFYYADKILNDEKTKYPNRKFKLIPANHINEILLNKYLAENAHDNLWAYFKKFIQNNKIIFSAILIFILTLFPILYYIVSENYSNNIVEETDFYEFAKSRLKFNEEKLGKIYEMGEIFNFSFDEEDLNKLVLSHEIEQYNIQPVKNRFNEEEKASMFNGEDSFIKIFENEKIKLDFPISVSMWFKKMDDNYGWLFANNYDINNYYGVFMGFVARNIPSLHFADGGELGNSIARRSIYKKEPIILGQWYHIVGIINSANDMSIYLNNEIIEYYYSGNATKINYNSGPSYFGKFNNSKIFPIPFFKGVMDDFRIFDRVLNEKEIDRLFHEKDE